MKKIVSIYSGKLHAPTGVASVIKELDKGKWDSFDMTHQVYTLDENGSVSNKTTLSNIKSRQNIKSSLKKTVLARASFFRKLLWNLSEQHKLIACLYIYIFHQLRAIRLVKCFISNKELSGSKLIVHDMWSLISLDESAYDLSKVVFVVHGSSSPVDFLENIFPSLIKTSTSSKLRASLASAISKVRCVVVLSESSLEKVSQQFGTQCEVIYNGLEPIASVRNESPNGLINIYLTGNVCKRKRQYLIPDILNNLRPEALSFIKFHVFGGGFIDNISRSISFLDLSEKVKFWGNTSNPSEHYREGDIILCISSEEGLPMALIEGIRSGCIPVTVDVGGCKEVVCDGGGFLINSLNDSAVIEEASKIIEEVVLNTNRKVYANNSIEHFKNKFSSQTMVMKYAKLF